MKNLTKILLLILLACSANYLFAQQTKSQVLDNFYEKQIYKEKEIIPYDHIREADVFWSHRIWRTIDVKEKMNLPFIYPKQNPPQMFIDILMEAAIAGEITVYSTLDDEFTTPMTPDEVKAIGARVDTLTVTDPETLEESTKIVPQVLDRKTIKKINLKEDWFFDEETSTFQVRILGISPVRDRMDDQGNILGPEPLFWAYYPQLRPVLIRWESFNILNDAVKMTWEDIFEMRLFASSIIKESNVYDRRIQDYATGIDALLEAEKIKNDMFLFEHDQWNF